MTAAEKIRIALTSALERGEDFEGAWASALSAALAAEERPYEKAAWATSLVETREAWKRAYEGEPVERGEDRVASLAAS